MTPAEAVPHVRAVNRALAYARAPAPHADVLTPDEVRDAAALIEWVARKIAANPGSYNQGRWCGTSRCLAGHAIGAVVPTKVVAGGSFEAVREVSRYLDLDRSDWNARYATPWINAMLDALVAPDWAFKASMEDPQRHDTPSKALRAIARDLRRIAEDYELPGMNVPRAACIGAWVAHWCHLT